MWQAKKEKHKHNVNFLNQLSSWLYYKKTYENSQRDPFEGGPAALFPGAGLPLRCRWADAAPFWLASSSERGGSSKEKENRSTTKKTREKKNHKSTKITNDQFPRERLSVMEFDVLILFFWWASSFWSCCFVAFAFMVRGSEDCVRGPLTPSVIFRTSRAFGRQCPLSVPSAPWASKGRKNRRRDITLAPMELVVELSWMAAKCQQPTLTWD